jgi:YfiH family protein
MIDQPFKIFAPFHDRLDVKFFTKEDRISSDKDLVNALGSEEIASLKQVHGNRIVTFNESSKRIEEADGAITNKYNLWLTIRAADCQLFVVYAPAKKIIGVVHAGWKGLKAGAILQFFSALKREHNVDPSETFVGIGPSFCEQCAEFTHPATELEGLNPRFFHGRHADLRGIADDQLDQIGVPRNQRERNPDCTKCMNDKYWSYRGGDKESVIEGYCNVFTCCLRQI